MVGPSAKTQWVSLDIIELVFASLNANSGVGAFFSSVLFFHSQLIMTEILLALNLNSQSHEGMYWYT